MNLYELDTSKLDATIAHQARVLGYIEYRYGKITSYEYAQTASAVREALEKNKRTRNALRIVDKTVNLEEDLTKARGTCPCCHLVLPFNGVCDCGYVKPDATDVASVYAKYAKPNKAERKTRKAKPQALKTLNKYARLLATLQ